MVELDVVDDPLDELEFVEAPGDEREGPIIDVVNEGLESRTKESEYVQMASEKDKPGSYHYSSAKRGHWSQSSGCSTQGYLNYIHKLDDELDPYRPDRNSKLTFTHGDLVHWWIQGLFLDELGEEFVTIEENIDDDLEGEYGVAGHADIVIRNHPKFPDPFVIDIKTTAEFTYYNYGKGGEVRSIPKMDHLKQLSGYMHHVGANTGALLYYSKRDDYIEEYWCSFNEELFEEGKRKIVNVLEHVNNGTVPEPDAQSYLCNPEYCAYKREGICPGVEDSDHHDPSDNRLDEFEREDPQWD